MDIYKTLTAVYEADEDGWYLAYIEEIPGVNTQGRTIEEARENLKDALTLVLDYRKEEAQKEQGSRQVTKEEIRMVA